MSEMVERVAETMRLRAIARGHPIHPTLVRHLAVAAIEAMREPTAAMWEAKDQPVWTLGRPMWDWWRSMIDAALK